jgi:hypothetical protein
MLLPRAVAAQDEPPATPESAATLPAEALAYGAALEGQTQRKLLDWAKKQARELLHNESSPGELSAERVEKLFPAQPLTAQQAIRFLVGYQAYHRASEQQATRAAILRDMDRDLQDLAERIRLLETFRDPIGTAAAARRQAALADAQGRLEQLEIQRTLATSAEKIERQRVDAWLRWLADVYPAVKEVPAGVLRSVPPPRS